MLKMMLVDDDYPVLEFLQVSIPWNELGLKLIGSYDNGIDALKHAEEEMPDILITDIGMPHMNGLELIEQLRKRQPKLRAVILSCQDEFEYARQAVRLGVQDYILKESFKPNYIREMLQKICVQLQEEKRSVEHFHRLKSSEAGNRSLRKQVFLERTLEDSLLGDREWGELASDFGIRIPPCHYSPVLCYLGDHNALMDKFGSHNILTGAVENIIEEMLRKIPDAAVTPYSSQLYVLWIPVSSAYFNEADMTVLESIQDSLHKYLSVRASFLLGEAVSNRREVKKVVGDLLLGSEEERFYYPLGSILPYEPLDFSEEDLNGLYKEASQQFLELFFVQNELRLRETLEYWMKRIREYRCRPAAVKEWFLKILYDMEMRLGSLNPSGTRYSTEAYHHTIAELGSLDELEAWMLQHLNTIIQLVHSVYIQAKRPEIMQAQRYIELHMNSKISLEEIAKELHMNASYFSRMYKKETGETFVEYVNRVKIERAKDLLRWSNHSVEGISESLGYDNKSYFAKLFKSLTGLTPGEYRGKGME